MPTDQPAPPEGQANPEPITADDKPSPTEGRSAPHPAATERSQDGDRTDGGDKLTLPKRRIANHPRPPSRPHDQPKRFAKIGLDHAKAIDEARRDGGRSVSIVASEPELGQMLALAAAISDPTIKIVRDGRCETRLADFSVKTLQDVTRLGPAIPLFSESLIILTRSGSPDIRSLRGRSVSFGMTGSSSQQIAQRLFSSYKVDVRETPLDLNNALDALALGDVDAVALLAPAGYKRFAFHGSELRLISLGDNAIPPEGLRITTIEPSSYLGGKWPERRVGVITVDAVLSPNQNPPRDLRALSVYAALDRSALTLAKSGFDLIGGDTLITMRSVADESRHLPAKIEIPAFPAFARDDC